MLASECERKSHEEVQRTAAVLSTCNNNDIHDRCDAHLVSQQRLDPDPSILTMNGGCGSPQSGETNRVIRMFGSCCARSI